jgi:hypothetical protein
MEGSRCDLTEGTAATFCLEGVGKATTGSVSQSGLFAEMKTQSLLNLKHSANQWARAMPRRPGFVPRSVHVGFEVDKVQPGQVFLRLLWFSHHNSNAAPTYASSGG